MNITKRQGKQIRETVSSLNSDQEKRAFMMYLMGYSIEQIKLPKDETKEDKWVADAYLEGSFEEGDR